MKQRRSISKSFMAALLASVVLVSLLSIYASTPYISRKADQRLDQNADKYIRTLCDILEEPLWDFNQQAIRNIGRIFANNEMVSKVKIRDQWGEVQYISQKENQSAYAVRSANITHNGRLIGSVEIALTPAYLDQMQTEMLKIAFFALGIMLICLFAVAGFLMRVFLKKPLAELGEVVESYADGNFDQPEPEHIPFVEFYPVMELLKSMGTKIKDQMAALEGELNERKKAEQALRQSEEDYRKLFEDHSAAKLIIDPETGGIVNANAAAEKFYGWSRQELGRMTIQQINTLTEPEVRTLIEEARTRKRIHFEFQHRLADGSVRSVEVFSSRVQMKGGYYLHSIIHDVTRQKQAEEESRKLQERLQQARKMEAIGTLAGGIAHDFNNILASVLGYAELAIGETNPDNQIYSYLQEIYAAGNRAKYLIRQILTFARSEEEEQPVQVSMIAKETSKLLRATLPATIEIREDIKSGSSVMGSPTQIHQLFMNLATNAGQAMEETGGILEIGLADTCLDDEFIRRYPDLAAGDYLKITVSDTGPGLPEDKIDSVFEPYFTTKDPGQGTGLGLATVHGIVKSCGGEIIAANRPGGGAEFTIYLPITGESIKFSEPEPGILPGGTEKILFVDDEAPIVEVNRRILEGLGYSVTPCTGSREALELFRSDPNAFDLVITDMTMPEMTGDKMAASIMEIRKDIPVILCTGYNKSINRESAAGIGIKEFVRKPVGKEKLAKLIRKVLDGAKDSF